MEDMDGVQAMAEDLIGRYENPLILIPMAAMFVIIFGIVIRSMREMPLFAGSGKAVIAFCVTVLAMYGMDCTLVKAVVEEYTAMGVAMLFGLVGLLLTAWIGLTVKMREHMRRSQQDNSRK